MNDLPSQLRNIRDHLRSGRFGLREVWEHQLADAAAEIERLRAGLNEIERKYAAIMNDPPDWIGMTDEQLKWAREAWYGASLIARRTLEQNAPCNPPFERAPQCACDPGTGKEPPPCTCGARVTGIDEYRAAD